MYGINRSTFYAWESSSAREFPTRVNYLKVLPKEENRVLEFTEISAIES